MVMFLVLSCLVNEWHVAPSYEPLITSSIFVGQLVGMLLCCPMADVYGRKTIVCLGWIIVCVFGILTIFAPNLWVFLLFRVIVGIGIGTSQVPVYDLCLEFFPQKYRSRLAFANCFIIFGELYIITSAQFILQKNDWRLLTLVSLVPSFILTIYGYLVLPESPLWLLQQGKINEAADVIKSLVVKESLKINDFVLQSNESSRISNVIEGNANFPPSIWTITKPMWMSWLFLDFSRYYSVILMLSYYSINLECNYNYDEMLFMSAVPMIGVIIALQTISVGRTLTLAIFSTLAGIFATVLLILSKGIINVGMILFIVASRTCIEGSTAALTLQTAELYPTELRATGHAMSLAWGRLGAFVAVYWINYSANASPFLSSLLFTVCCMIGSILASKLPETKQLRLDGRDDSYRYSDLQTDEHISLIRHKAFTGHMSWTDSNSEMSDLTQ